MPDDTKDPKNNEESRDLPRRDFVAMSVAAGLAAASSVAGAASVVETDVEIKTPDGTCDAAFIHPAGGSHPGVLIWTDAFGLRPSMREMGKRLAAQGYSVLVPNPFYRMGKAPFWTDASSVDFGKDRAKIGPLMGSVTAIGNAEKDAVAYIEFLDKQKQVNKSKKIGTQGYCMGGPLVVRTAATVPDRVGAGGSFHGGGLVTRQAQQSASAGAEDQSQNVFRHRDERRQAATRREGQTEGSVHRGEQSRRDRSIRGRLHGWCVPDMPKQADGTPTYNKPDAEKAWAKLTALYKGSLA